MFGSTPSTLGRSPAAASLANILRRPLAGRARFQLVEDGSEGLDAIGERKAFVGDGTL
jgi:hypothetical protein